MAKAIEAGIPKLRIEEAAARTQARIDSGRQPVIGVNKYRVDDDEPIDVLKVDNSAVRERADRQAAAAAGRARRGRRARHALRALTGRRSADRDRPSGNLLQLAVDAARAKATVGEITDALEKVYGRHTRADPYDLGRVPQRGRRGHAGRSSSARALVERFEQAEGRRPRILVAKMGQDGHDRGQKVIATALRRPGLRRRHRPAVPDPGRGRPPGGRGRRARRRGALAGRRAPDPGARAARRAGRAGPRRHHDRRSAA